jgi:methionyl-tRNA formyltransferase
MGKRKKVVVLGKGDLSVKVADWFRASPVYDIICVVPNVPPSTWTASLDEWAIKNGVPIVASGLTSDVPPGPIDLAISVTYDKIIKSNFIERCGRIINIHNGPLPKYRGVNPINWALKNNERKHGVTIHEITPGIDNGPIVAQAMFDIDPDRDEVIDVYRRCLEVGWSLFQSLMPKFWESLPRPQDHDSATYYSKKEFDRLGERRFFTRAESR